MSDKFLIAPFEGGLQRDLKPWLIPDSAFKELRNAYVFRGRVRRRFGSFPIGVFTGSSHFGETRLRINIGTTDVKFGDIAVTVPLGASGVGDIGQMFSVGDDEVFTVWQANGDMLSTSATATVYTFNTATGAVDIQGAEHGADVYYYPALPVMGFARYESASVNNEPSYAFDTRFAYTAATGAWERLGVGLVPASPDTWSGTDSDFFWTTTYRGVTADIRVLFATNYVLADQMRYLIGATWTAWNPAFLVAGGNTVETARVIIQFKDRLLLLNTKEKVGGVDKTFVNRCRFSAIGSPLAAAAFVERPDGSGGLVDCPIKESIISAFEFKDRLIVFFERSTWELAYTGNEIVPFVWREINIEQGAESTFSVVPFDTAILGVGQDGIYACNGYNVQRIDAKIPDEVFKFHNNDDGPLRVQGIRDYRAELVYWAVPNKARNSVYPNRVLTYNYNTNTWAYFDDSITAFGYTYLIQDYRWTDLDIPWEEEDFTWDSHASEEAFRTPIAGNQQGWTFVIVPDLSTNSVSLQITNILDVAGVITFTVINHNLQTGDWIYIRFAEITTEFNEYTWKVNVIDADTFSVDETPDVTLPYAGGGIISLVSKIDIKTKEFNFYTQAGVQTSIEKADFLVDKVDGGEITVDYIPSSSGISLRDDGIATGAILGTSVLDLAPFDNLQETQNDIGMLFIRKHRVKRYS